MRGNPRPLSWIVKGIFFRVILVNTSEISLCNNRNAFQRFAPFK